jgi:hypothetical protein
MGDGKKQRRERAIVDLFVEVYPTCPRIEVAEYRDRPDAVVRSGTALVGIEVTELLVPEDGRDRSLEAIARQGIEAACRNELGDGGDVDVEMRLRPRDRAQVEGWLREFRSWLKENRRRLLEQQVLDHGVFPDARPDLAWLWVKSIYVAHGGWTVYGLPTGDQFADRHRHDVDALLVDAVAGKCKKAENYDFRGPLWLLVRNAVRQQPSVDASERLASIAGIFRFAEVWLLDWPANVLDAAHEPSARRLLPRGEE